MENRRHIIFDRLFAWAIGIGVAILASVTGNSLELPPELWDEIAVAAKLRPPEHEFPLLWQHILSYFISQFGISPCIAALKAIGPISLGLLAVMTFRLFSGYLPRIMHDMYHSTWGRWIVRLLLMQGTLFFVASDPVWRAGRVFSPEIFTLSILIFILLTALRAFEKSSVPLMMLMGFISGVMLAETPVALLPPLFSALYLRWGDWEQTDPNTPPLANPIVFTVSTRRMMWMMIFGWSAAVTANSIFFRTNGITGDTGVFIGFIQYLMNYFRVFKTAATPAGWLLIISVALMPAVIAVARIRALSRPEQLLPFPYSCFFIVAGSLAFLQSTGFEDCHFWRWADDCVRSQLMLCLSILATSLTAVLALTAFTVDIYFRNHGKLLREIFPEEFQEEPLAVRAVRSFYGSIKFLRPLMRIEPLLAIAAVLPFKFDTTVREMAAVVNTVVKQTADECADAAMLFTDGSLDAAVETAAAEKGRRLKALSMMSGHGKYDTALRERGVSDKENRELLAIGAADALRTWVTDKNPCVSNIALQVGLELWQHNHLPLPQAGGLVSRTVPFPDGSAEKYAQSARDIANRILQLYDGGDMLKFGYPELNRLFLLCQWRLSRMCRIRANEADRNQNPAASEVEHALADRLDRANSEWQQVQEKMDWIGKQGGMRLTPREGLKLGLERADFRLARSYARKIIADDENDLQANFALGMGFYTEKQYGRAEAHLKKCLIKAPREPAVLNNLAIVQLRLGRYDEAEANALKALEAWPESSEIKTTLRHIRAAKKGDAAKDAPVSP
jgi:tetratricopeptide (TPR) repeat protein